MQIENQLKFWVTDYRCLVQNVIKLDEMLPKTDHDAQKSEDQAQENVEKIRKVEDIKEKVIKNFKDLCLKLEDVEENSKRKIENLELEMEEMARENNKLQTELRRLKRKCC